MIISLADGGDNDGGSGWRHMMLAKVAAELNDEVQEDGFGDETKALNEDEYEIVNEFQVPSNFTNIEGINKTTVDNWQCRTFGVTSISIPALRAEIINKLGYTSSYKKVWMGNEKAVEHVFGNWDDSYTALPKFLSALQHFNRDSVVEWFVTRLDNNQVEFIRVFWTFAPSIKGFEHCRPVISIDATHLYDKYNGKMMIAMGVDANNQIFPLAFAIAENESYNSWYWFLSHVVNEEGSPWLEPGGFHRLVHYFDLRRPQGIHSQVSEERYAPHVVAKQEALKLKASAHVVRSFNRERGIFEKHIGPTQSSFVGELLPNSNLKRVKSGRPRSTRIHNGMDIKEGKKKKPLGDLPKKVVIIDRHVHRSLEEWMIITKQLAINLLSRSTCWR
ncbi:serine/threonine-protein phosphatase 7 long form-like protein [Tanacetum coccineum]